jgi:hypothetical protein
MRRGRLWWVGLQALIASVLANLVIRAAAMAVFDIPAEFPPLQGPGPTIVFTVAGVLAAVIVFAAVRRFTSGAVPLFRAIAIVALLLSLTPDVWMFTTGARPAFPGATVASVGTLMLMHVVTAATVVWMLTVKGSHV